MTRLEDLLDQALALPSDERIRIALELLDSVEPPDPLGHLDDEAWAAEIRRRAERGGRAIYDHGPGMRPVNEAGSRLQLFVS